MPSDNRDIFDKALDYAPVVGAVLGASAARKMYDRKVWQSERLKNFHRGRKNLVTVAGGGAGYMAGSFPKMNEEGKRRK